MMWVTSTIVLLKGVRFNHHNAENIILYKGAFFVNIMVLIRMHQNTPRLRKKTRINNFKIETTKWLDSFELF